MPEQQLINLQITPGELSTIKCGVYALIGRQREIIASAKERGQFILVDIKKDELKKLEEVYQKLLTA